MVYRSQMSPSKAHRGRRDALHPSAATEQDSNLKSSQSYNFWGLQGSLIFATMHEALGKSWGVGGGIKVE